MNLVSFALRKPVTVLVLVIAAVLAGVLAIAALRAACSGVLLIRQGAVRFQLVFFCVARNALR